MWRLILKNDLKQSQGHVNIHTYIIILRLHLSVHVCVYTAGRSPEAIGPELKSFLSRAWDVTIDSPLTRLAMDPAVTEVSRFTMTAGQN
jgi:hypothetical protein